MFTIRHNKKPISLFKKSFKDEKRLKEIKETKEGKNVNFICIR